jgi:hypothetical protein
MRIFVTIIVWVVFIGGLTLYMNHRGSADYSANNFHEFKLPEKVYALEVTPSFVLESDPFALNIDSRKGSPALLVRLGEHIILKVDDPLTSYETYKVEPLHGLIIGENEIYIEASPPLNHISTQNALRIQIIKNGYPLAEKTIWSPPGSKVSGTFQFTLKADDHNFSEENHAHQ